MFTHQWVRFGQNIIKLIPIQLVPVQWFVIKSVIRGSEDVEVGVDQARAYLFLLD